MSYNKIGPVNTKIGQANIILPLTSTKAVVRRRPRQKNVSVLKYDSINIKAGA